MKNQIIHSFPVIGITVRTSNADGSAAKDIPELWDRFWSANIAAQIPGVISNDVYSIYTAYDGDYTQPYTTLIGYRVENLDHIPEGLSGLLIEGGSYQQRSVKGNLLKGVVFDAWVDIWNSDIPRAYTSDFEVYGEKAQNPEDAVVDIYLSVKL
ncbi:GyrI-like domain-containing protein [Pedobacter heparinus]|uniref:Transcription activator effector binding n=1 Tax=Pedobacter heparinus (strain ATCC 13125 / DSM 2366 / CIP 104194 / JCM 7457 / NBRC 12017 / NCIMB 9290 / NRRL B-14731 / HIM 762-3) TaxID=485917 RepID=C6XU86_PEDHD|nr:GyrI-like domain-containing protein [Pedobacter heparinus]ACU05879.1 transcription activator effector binding [Pedobacter heparinus DSM 2366]